MTSNAAECKIQQIEKPFPWVHDHEGGGGGGGGGGVLVSSWEPVKALARVLKKFYQVENETTESCATRKQKQMDNVNHVLRIDANGGEEEEFCEFMRFTLFHDQVICRNSCEDHTIETGTVSAAAAALG